MKKLIVLMLVFSGAAQAALVDRGGGFIYDDILDITWTQNANINGLDTWDNQVSWADGLSLYDSVRDVTWDDWRLARVDVNGDNVIVDCLSASELVCRDNELGYMYYQNDVTSAAPGLFTGVQSAVPYWSGTENNSIPGTAHTFYFQFGAPFPFPKEDYLFNAWAVRDGDVAASVVPIPAAVWLFASGLGLFGWLRRRQTA